MDLPTAEPPVKRRKKRRPRLPFKRVRLCGIYAFVDDREPDKVLYVGKGQDMFGRRSQHTRAMVTGERTAPFHRAMRERYADPRVLTFHILEICPADKLDEREMHYYVTLNPEFNAQRPKLTPELRKKIRDNILRRVVLLKISRNVRANFH